MLYSARFRLWANTLYVRKVLLKQVSDQVLYLFLTLICFSLIFVADGRRIPTVRVGVDFKREDKPPGPQVASPPSTLTMKDSEQTIIGPQIVKLTLLDFHLKGVDDELDAGTT